MIEDKLTHDERLRLECVAQAIAAKMPVPYNAPITEALKDARAIEAYVRGDQ